MAEIEKKSSNSTGPISSATVMTNSPVIALLISMAKKTVFKEKITVSTYGLFS